MSELELSEKITHSIGVKIATLIDETKMNEKIADVTVNIGICISAFALFASVVGVTNIALHYSNINSNNKNNKLLNESISRLSENIEINHFIYDKRVSELEEKFNKLLEFQQESQQNCLNEIKKIQSEKKITISKSTSISDLSFISDEEKKVKDEEKQEEDDELINECYDSLPLNNLKKTYNIKLAILNKYIL